MAGRPWTKEEDKELRELELTDAQFADRFNRSKRSIESRRYKLGITTRYEPWTESEVRALADISKSDHEIAEKLGRNVHTVKSKRLSLGIKRDRPDSWTEWADRYLLENYKVIDTRKLEIVLGRTAYAIRKRYCLLMRSIREQCR